MRGAVPGGERGGGRGSTVMLNAASKVVGVMDKMLLPLLDAAVGTHVSFVAVDEQSEFDLFDEMRRRRPSVMEDAETFARHARDLYGRYLSYSGGEGRT
jgi:hypothetical protein